MSYYDIENETTGAQAVELYTFSHVATVWRYTSAVDAVTVAGETYIPEVIDRSSIQRTTEIEKAGLTITARSKLPVALLFQPYPPTERVRVTVARALLSGGTEVAELLYTGNILSASWSDSGVELEAVNLFAAMRRRGLRLHIQRQCPHVLFLARCGATRQAVTVTIVQVNGNNITIETDQHYADHIFAGGAMEWREPVSGELRRRMILDYTGSAQLIRLAAAMPGLSAGQNVELYQGCAHTLTDCKDRYSNVANYGGYPYMPDLNPFGSDPVF